MTTTIGEQIAAQRKRKYMSREALAEILEIAPETLARYERGNRKPNADIIAKLATVLGVTTDYLMGRTDDPAPADIKKEPAPQHVQDEPNKEHVVPLKHYGINGDKSLMVPVYEDFLSACAGRGTNAAEIEASVKEFLEIPLWLLCGEFSREPGKMPFIVTVYGDSMVEAGIPDGSQVLVNPVAEPRDRDVIIAQLDGEWMIKWIYWDRYGGGELRSSSIKYPPRPFVKEDVENGRFVYIGKVIRGLPVPKRGE